MSGWGYTVVPISASASQATFDAGVLTSSVAYVSNTITPATLGTKLVATTIPVLNEEDTFSDEFGFSSTATTFNSAQINITNTTHYITSQFPAGALSIFSSNQPLRYPAGTLGSFTTLAQKIGSGQPSLVYLERADTIYPSGSAPGRRLYLPWGGNGMDINTLTASGQTLMKRSIEWALLPLAWYKLDDASGTTAADSAGSYNGTLSGATWTTGRKAGGLRFNGSTDYVSIANATAFQVTGALTITGWIKQTAAFPTGSTVSLILRKGDSNPNNWQLCVANGKVELLLDGNDGSGIDGNTTLSINTWYHVAATWNGATARLYLNGVLDMVPAARAAPIAIDARPVYLGGRIGSTDVTNGSLDDVRFYNRCLTAAEIAALAKANPAVMTWQQAPPP